MNDAPIDSPIDIAWRVVINHLRSRGLAVVTVAVSGELTGVQAFKDPTEARAVAAKVVDGLQFALYLPPTSLERAPSP